MRADVEISLTSQCIKGNQSVFLSCRGAFATSRSNNWCNVGIRGAFSFTRLRLKKNTPFESVVFRQTENFSHQ